VDQDLGDGQIHTYLGDWQTSTSYFIVSRGNKVIGCMNFPNPDAVPSPGFFRHSEFKGRFQVNGALCQLWKAKLHDRPIDLYVKETDQSPVRYVWSQSRSSPHVPVFAGFFIFISCISSVDP
jgi:hypothetical protein